jgi:hypothetical protein
VNRLVLTRIAPWPAVRLLAALAGGLGGLLYNLLARLLGGIPLMFEPEPSHVVADPGHAGA